MVKTIKELLKKYKNKDLSSKEVIAHFAKRSKEFQPKLNHYITLNEHLKDIPKNAIPVAHKDIFSTKGVKTTCASKVLENYIPPYSSTSVEKLEKENFYSLGKLNCDAFAHGSTGENSDFGATKNPYDLKRVAGGSSSGSAAAVASGSVLLSTATDTGGSIRVPSSFNNIVGIKPTYGRVSRYGISAMTSSTDTVGHMTHTIWDNAYVLGITAGKDYRDATSSPKKVEDYTAELESYSPISLTIGLPKEYFDENVDPLIKEQVMKNVDLLKKRGAKIKKVSLPNTKYGVASYYVITPSEVSSNLGRLNGIRYGEHRDRFGDEAVRRIMIGTFSLSSGYYDAYYSQAQKVRNALTDDFNSVFKQVDVIISPVSSLMPPKIGEQVDDPLKNYLMDALTIPVNMAGVPSLSVPAGFINNLPVGLQIIGPKFSEHLLYKVGSVIERETEYYKIAPKL
jgi:aspartyl-tRNA(Asn)/glutamyl-tRNA(Gln) amidotransferase subunit A